ncbi:phosphoglycolate phosphatase [Lampropedia puyangensis]|uniref:phosphoglycolate phosphatase n=1 Tax=Lampropedia puyangensis TaxID=1330072 RepID=A0A4S8F124_9BURK|nr:phosphoglycolate phosphatase [Lampropedia puyangensis]THU00983.1 phosphoglycolate phosphatase [Lampropedia puyangensis]
MNTPSPFLLAPNSIQAVLLDLDGTLINTLDEFVAALNFMSDAMQLPHASPQFVAQTIGKGSEHLVRVVLQMLLLEAKQPHDAQSIEHMFEQAMHLYFTGYEAAGTSHVKVYPGVREGLEQIRAKGYPMGIVTNKPTRLAMPLLHDTGLARYAEFLIAGDTYAKRKPDPYPLIQACTRLQTMPAHTLMIGDSANDAAAARAAQCPIAILRYGFNHGNPVETIDADGYFDSIEEIARLLPSIG